MSKTTKIVPPRPSASVILGRDSDHGPEFLLMKRQAGNAFGSAHVFPGGVLDAGDSDVDSTMVDIDEASASACLGEPCTALAYYVGVLRELFEETGVLLAAGSIDAAEASAARNAVHDRRQQWSDFLRQHALTLQASELEYVSHWITPEVMPVRFDTRFFVARMPAGQVAEHDGVELTDSSWMRPPDALEAASNERILLHFPTQTLLRSLAHFASMGEALQWAQRCQQEGIKSITPRMPGGDRHATPVLP